VSEARIKDAAVKGYPACYAGGVPLARMKRRRKARPAVAEDAWGSPERKRELFFDAEQFRCGLLCACRGLAAQRFQQ